MSCGISSALPRWAAELSKLSRGICQILPWKTVGPTYNSMSAILLYMSISDDDVRPYASVLQPKMIYIIACKLQQGTELSGVGLKCRLCIQAIEFYRSCDSWQYSIDTQVYASLIESLSWEMRRRNSAGRHRTCGIASYRRHPSSWWCWVLELYGRFIGYRLMLQGVRHKSERHTCISVENPESMDASAPQFLNWEM